jgi:hypothetical protein
MLVYTEAKQAEEQNSTEKKSNETKDKTGVEWCLPERLCDLLKTEDQKFEDWVKEMNETKVFNCRDIIFTITSCFFNLIRLLKLFLYSFYCYKESQYVNKLGMHCRWCGLSHLSWNLKEFVAGMEGVYYDSLFAWLCSVLPSK